MNVVRDLRQRAGLTQQALAARAGTSQSAIAAYEAGSKSPRLSTVARLAEAAGLEVAWRLVPPLTRTDRRSLTLHAHIAEAVRRDPQAHIERARRNLDKMQKSRPGARQLLDEWERWLRLPVQQLTDRMLDPATAARDMRQVTPFAGSLPARERARAYRDFVREEGRSYEAKRV